MKTVLLNGCNIGQRGVKALSKVLKHNQTVEHLDLFRNHIGNVGAEWLINALCKNVCIMYMFVLSENMAPASAATIKYCTQTRNKILIPAAARRASLYLVAARRTRNYEDMGDLAAFPKEIVKMIAMEVYLTRKDPIWMNALTDSERTGKSGD